MHIDDKRSIVEAKQNEINYKNLAEYYGNPNEERIEDAYPEEPITVEGLLEMVEYLEYSSYPEHIRLAKFLREQSKIINEEYEKAQAILRKKTNQEKPLSDKTVKTIYREFLKIEKRKKRLEKSKAMSLNWFKDVKNFITNDLSRVVKSIRNKNFNLETIDGREELVKYLSSKPELKFVHTSKLTRKVR